MSRTVFSLVSLAVVTQFVKAANDTLTRVDLTSIDPTAVCNDGTPAIYMWKKSPTNSTRWTVFLAGGGSCYDEASCAERWKFDAPPLHHLMSSKN